MKESSLNQKIKAHVYKTWPKSKGIKIHGNQYMELGTPDLFFCLNPTGRLMVIETKIDGKVPRPNQLKRLEEWGNAGAIAFWCDSYEDYIQKIKPFM